MKKQKGFTLIELLVVIAIIGLLATIAAVALNNARTSSRDTKRLADIKQIQTGLELYFNARNTYPYDDAAGLCGATNVLVSAIDDSCKDGDDGVITTIKTFIGGIDTIKDPSGTTACGDAPTAVCNYTYEDAGGNLATDGSTYKIHFYLEGSAGGFVTGGLTATPSGITQP